MRRHWIQIHLDRMRVQCTYYAMHHNNRKPTTLIKQLFTAECVNYIAKHVVHMDKQWQEC